MGGWKSAWNESGTGTTWVSRPDSLPVAGSILYGLQSIILPYTMIRNRRHVWRCRVYAFPLLITAPSMSTVIACCNRSSQISQLQRAQIRRRTYSCLTFALCLCVPAHACVGVYPWFTAFTPSTACAAGPIYFFRDRNYPRICERANAGILL